MSPGKVFTADDGSTVELQCLIQEGREVSDGLIFIRPPDRVKDVRLLLTAPDGTCHALHMRSPSAESSPDVLLTMYGHVRPPLHARDGIVNDPMEWSGPLCPTFAEEQLAAVARRQEQALLDQMRSPDA